MGPTSMKRKALWDDPDLMEFLAETTDEPGLLIAGTIGAMYWSGVITFRDNTVRIISVRRSPKEELDIFEGWGIRQKSGRTC
jgi:uncharacterized protein